ncbi:MAG: LSU ribosomal protein L28p @ LSU ribosomal protein L28p, zinc-dependent, partial [uncultured Rubrobacteraceae bacterium]
GESLLFLWEAAQLRQRAQPFPSRHAPPLEPEPAEDPDPGRRSDEARLRLYLLPEGVQGPEGRAPHAPRAHRKHPSV